MSKIPDRWIPYKACGNVIEGTRFICFKVPLKKSVQMGNRDIKEIWDIPTLLAKIPKLIAVIDLTNTARYYDPNALIARGVLHKKIFIPGRIIPPEDKVKEFMDTVDEFLGRDCESLVGVHCTHGLNRTGYMICRYMRDRLAIPAKDTIKRFEKARGYQIERKNYIEDLMGNEPPPPDVGQHTEVKPIYSKNSMVYQSPLGDEETAYNDYNRRNRYGFNGRSSRDERGSETNWRSGRRDQNDGRSDRSNAKPSYDYRYDY